MVLHEEEFPIKEELKTFFPNLLANGMKYFELKQQDDEIVSHQELEEPLRVSANILAFRFYNFHNFFFVNHFSKYFFGYSSVVS